MTAVERRVYRRRSGLCMACSEKRSPCSRSYCDYHLTYHRLLGRVKLGKLTREEFDQWNHGRVRKPQDPREMALRSTLQHCFSRAKSIGMDPNNIKALLRREYA